MPSVQTTRDRNFIAIEPETETISWERHPKFTLELAGQTWYLATGAYRRSQGRQRCHRELYSQEREVEAARRLGALTLGAVAAEQRMEAAGLSCQIRDLDEKPK